MAYLEFCSKKAKEEHESARGHQDRQLKRIFLASTELHV